MGFSLDIWDYITFVVIFIGVVAILVLLIFVLSLPGRIAVARRHPEAEAVKMMGYAGFLAVVPWIRALIWAFKPTDVVDIRYFPREEQEDIDKTIARLRGESGLEKAEGTQEARPDVNDAG